MKCRMTYTRVSCTTCSLESVFFTLHLFQRQHLHWHLVFLCTLRTLCPRHCLDNTFRASHLSFLMFKLQNWLKLDWDSLTWKIVTREVERASSCSQVSYSSRDLQSSINRLTISSFMNLIKTTNTHNERVKKTDNGLSLQREKRKENCVFVSKSMNFSLIRSKRKL